MDDETRNIVDSGGYVIGNFNDNEALEKESKRFLRIGKSTRHMCVEEIMAQA